MSLRSISVDDTPDNDAAEDLDEANAVIAGGAVSAVSARQQIQQRRQEHLDRLARDGQDLLSPPDVSLTSISPGEETDEATTVTATPSSATVTPNRALPGAEELSEVLIKEKMAGVVTRRVKKSSSHASHRASYPSGLAPVSELKGAAGERGKRLSVGSGSGSGSNSTVNTINSSSNSSVERLSSHGGDDCKHRCFRFFCIKEWAKGDMARSGPFALFLFFLFRAKSNASIG